MAGPLGSNAEKRRHGTVRMLSMNRDKQSVGVIRLANDVYPFGVVRVTAGAPVFAFAPGLVAKCGG